MRHQFLARGHVGKQRGPSQVQRSLLRESYRIKRRHCSARSAEEDHHPTRPQNVQSLLECRLAHRVVDHIHALAAGQSFGFSFEICLRVQDHFICARALRQLCLLLGGNGGDHACSNVVRHLHQQKSHAACRGMNQRRLAALQRIRIVRQVVRRHALQHRASGLLISHPLRNRHQPVCRHGGILGIRPQQPGPGHTIPHLERLHFRTDRGHRSRAFLPQNKRQRRLVPPLTEVDIDKVHARRSQLHHRLVRLRLRDRQLRHFHRFRSADLFDLNGFHGQLDSLL